MGLKFTNSGFNITIDKQNRTNVLLIVSRRYYMASKIIEARIMCPFYLRESKTTIMCEGAIGNTICAQKFQSIAEKARHEVDYCCKEGGKRCPQFRAVSMKYY